MRKALTFEQLLKGTNKLIPVEITEMGAADGEVSVVYIRPIPAKEALDFQVGDANDQEKAQEMQRKMVASALCDENGNRLLGPDQFDMIGELPTQMFLKLVKITMEQLGVDTKAIDAAVEDKMKSHLQLVKTTSEPAGEEAQGKA